MFIDLRKTPEGSSSAKVQLTFSEMFQNTGIIHADFPATISIDRNGGELFVTVLYACTVSLECARCCCSFEQVIEGDAHFVLRSAKESEANGEEDLDEYVYESEKDRIDFSQSVYDDCMVRIPVKPLCDTECPGFEYSEAEPEVEQTVESEIDGRWSALAKLKNK